MQGSWKFGTFFLLKTQLLSAFDDIGPLKMPAHVYLKKKKYHLLPPEILCSPQPAVGPPNLQPQYLLQSLLADQVQGAS